MVNKVLTPGTLINNPNISKCDFMILKVHWPIVGMVNDPNETMPRYDIINMNDYSYIYKNIWIYTNDWNLA